MLLQERIALLLLIVSSSNADRRQSTIERAQLAIRKHIELSPHRSLTEVQLSQALLANPRASSYSVRNQTYTVLESLISSSIKCGRLIEELRETRVKTLKREGARLFWGCRDQFTCCEWGCCYNPDTRSDTTIALWVCAFIFAALFLFLLLMAIRRVSERKRSEVLFKAPPCSLGVIHSSCNHSAAEHKKSIVIVEGEEKRKKSTIVAMKKNSPAVVVEEMV
ncbi:hypothetical protein PRIPAC_80048 [Pristionchus pacificus]|uniref:Uncharacterized protein n=1 Tax=Pristionchus pacificus TaxID=54126 RepID=A0A2A6C3R3_PRIPA|nr:hypothetical protein PRIPAC_80048 [Pristionchus pacificus]|eukprot:PDM72738.1 hypothetical protein PRIPAC_39172 [Pristionchus pacificus]